MGKKVNAAAAVAVIAVGAAAEYFFDLGFVARRGRNPSPDMSVWDPESIPAVVPASVKDMGKRRRRNVRDPDYDVRRDEVRRKVDEGRKWILSMNPERWHITSADGIPLVAHYIPAENPRAIFIMVHGYRSSGLRDFSCAAAELHSMGISMLITDNRGHGESGGKYISYGVLERFDVVRWAKEAERRFPDVPVILDGISMGAATVLMAASLPLPENVRGVVADSGFTSPSEILRSVMKRMYRLPAFPLLPIARAMCRKRCGFDFESASAEDSSARTRVPIFFVHGTGDSFVPHDMSERNYSRAPENMARLVLVDGAEHAQSYLCDPVRYRRELEMFIDDCLK